MQEASKTQTTKLQVCRHTQRLRKPKRRSSRCAKTPGVIKNSKIEPPGVQRPIENAKLEPPGVERHPEPLKTKKSSLQVCRDTRSRRKPKKRTSSCAETPGAVENPKSEHPGVQRHPEPSKTQKSCRCWWQLCLVS